MASILIVEDEVSLRSTYKMILERNNHTVCLAKDGQDGLDKLAAFKPDIILLDINMPVLDGIGFLEKADIPSKHPDSKVIVFTNLEETKRLDQAYKLGAERYVLKSSLSPSQLIELVDEHIAK